MPTYKYMIILKDTNPINVKINSEFTEPGFYFVDTTLNNEQLGDDYVEVDYYDSSIKSIPNIDTSKESSESIKYSFPFDDFGNYTGIWRTINIIK